MKKRKFVKQSVKKYKDGGPIKAKKLIGGESLNEIKDNSTTLPEFTVVSTSKSPSSSAYKTLDWLKQNQEYNISNQKATTAFVQSWLDSGTPAIHDKEFDRAYYIPGVNKMHIAGNLKDEYFAELAHSVQNKRDSKFLGRKYKSDTPGGLGYNEFGSIEHEAHSIIEPKLKKTYDNLKKDKRKVYSAKVDIPSPWEYASGGQIGSTVGSAVGAASNLLVPGLGNLLSPLLSSLGSAIGGQSDARSDVEKQVGQMTVNKNPYGLKKGGVIKDRNFRKVKFLKKGGPLDKDPKPVKKLSRYSTDKEIEDNSTTLPEFTVVSTNKGENSPEYKTLSNLRYLQVGMNLDVSNRDLYPSYNIWEKFGKPDVELFGSVDEGQSIANYEAPYVGRRKGIDRGKLNVNIPTDYFRNSKFSKLNSPPVDPAFYEKLIQGKIEDYTRAGFEAEMAHAAQWNNLSLEESNMLQQKTNMEAAKFGVGGRYKVPGAVEYEAHSVIEPGITKYAASDKGKTDAKRVKIDLPGVAADKTIIYGAGTLSDRITRETSEEVDVRSFNYGGFLTGMEDASVYKGRLHSKGGILVNSKGVPSGKPAAEVEGGETVVKINGKSYVFSDRLKI